MTRPLDEATLRADFHAGFRPGEPRVGLEYELLPLDPTSGEQIPYDGHRSVRAALGRLITDFGWHATGSDPLIELAKGNMRLTLEPGAQVELSGSPHASIAGVAAELVSFIADLTAVGRQLEIAWVPVGVTPVSPPDSIVVIPKSRYRIMTRYLPTRGADALWMMRCTAGMQVNLDATSPREAARLARVLWRAAPLVSALFANSPLALGQPSGWQSRRVAIWSAVDPDRCGYPPRGLQRDFTLDDYVDWALGVPMFFVQREAKLIELTGVPFRDFLQHGAQGLQPTLDDWQLHLSTLFPEVRIKRYLEVRCADSNRPELALAFAALLAGLAYGGSEGLGVAERTLGDWSREQHLAFQLAAARDGLAATTPDGRPLRELVQTLITLGQAGLADWSPRDLPALNPLIALAGGERAPALAVRDRFEQLPRAELIRSLAL